MILHPLYFRMRQIYFLSDNTTKVTELNSSLDVGETETPILSTTMVLLMVLVALFILITVLGNTLVILAFIVDNRLRNQSNFFLLNLAICDFFIGAFCIPMYVPYLFTGKWMLGKFLCKLWLIVDNLMCTASAFNVVLISCDRFLSVTMAVFYRAQQKRHSQTVLKMAAVWILSSLLYSPAILFWEYIDSDKPIPQSLCVPGYYYSWHFLIGASAFDFLLPLISISFFNLTIYCNIKKRSKKKRHVHIPSIPLPSSKKESSLRPYIISDNIVIDGPHIFSTPLNPTVKKSLLPLLKQFFHKDIVLSSPPQHHVPRNNIRVIKLSHDKKIAKSLSVLVCIFGICWAPYSLLMSIRAACHDYCIESYWFEITFWMLWINSSINPFLYPLCHKSFRKAFIKVFYTCLQHTE